MKMFFLLVLCIMLVGCTTHTVMTDEGEKITVSELCERDCDDMSFEDGVAKTGVGYSECWCLNKTQSKSMRIW